MSGIDLRPVELRTLAIPAEALVVVSGQHPTLAALQASAADVRPLVAEVKRLRGCIESALDAAHRGTLATPPNVIRALEAAEL